MAAQPLEAIPEETATPAVAPTVAPPTHERVTSDVPKTKPAKILAVTLLAKD